MASRLKSSERTSSERTSSERIAARTAPPAGESLPDQVFQELVRLFWGARQYDQSLQRRHGVTASQLSTLRALERRGPLTQSELSGLLFVSGSTLSSLLARLEGKGLIARQRPAEDRRTVQVRLTAEGQAQLARIPRGRTKFGALRRLLNELPPGEVKRFLGTLRKMTGLLDAEAVKGEGA
jgi:DNA-binding MarR family transcriptional regulator